MAAHGYASSSPSRGSILTPVSSEDDWSGLRNLSIDDDQRDYRLFKFRKTGKLWQDGSKCSESKLSEQEIKTKLRTKLEAQIRNMKPSRQKAVNELVKRVNEMDANGSRWDVATIINDDPGVTRSTGEVARFSVILKRGKSDTKKSYAQDGIKHSSAAPQDRGRTYAETENFASPRQARIYDGASADEKNQKQKSRQSQTQIDPDPLGVAPLFAPTGKPIDIHGNAPFETHGLPAFLPKDAPIGAQVKDQSGLKKNSNNAGKQFKKKKSQSFFDANGELDYAALLGGDFGKPKGHSLGSGAKPLGTALGGHPLDPLPADHGYSLEANTSGSEIESSIIDVGEDYTNIRRGRKRDSGYAGKTSSMKPMVSHALPKSKSRSRGPPLRRLQIPHTSSHKGRPAMIYPSNSNSKRRSTQFYFENSGHSASGISDFSPLDTEHEDFTSSGSSIIDVGQAYHLEDRDGRQRREYTRRQSPPYRSHKESYDPEPYNYPSRPNRLMRTERHVSEGALQPYYPSKRDRRPPIVSYGSTPKFAPSAPFPPLSSYPLHSYEENSHLVDLIYPNDLGFRARRDSIHGAETRVKRYISNSPAYGRDVMEDEYELIARQKAELERKEAELFRREDTIARRQSTSGRAGSKYNHEPRRTSRYTDMYHP